MSKEKPEKPQKKAKDEPVTNAAPAPAKKAKAPSGETKAKAAKSPKSAKATEPAATETAAPVAKTEAPAAPAAAPAPPVEQPATAPTPKPKEPTLTASERRMQENKSAEEAKKTAPAAAPAPEPAAKPAAPTATASAATAAAKPTDPVAHGPEDAALAAQQLKDKIVVIRPPIIVKDLAAKLGLKPFQIIHHLMEMNIFTSSTQALEEEVARKLTTKLGFTFEIEKREKGAGQIHAPVKIVEPPQPEPTQASDLQPRPPVITFMGHVDHGKTSLLDSIRKARVAAGEAGGITQHIGAYTVKRGNQTITFLDTPGHEAFTAMRARGAKTTDIVVLVVAADDGIMPTTLEAIQHARAAKVQLMVAINKIDLPSANLNRVKGQLQEHGLVPEEYGGDTIICEVSATKGVGIEKLLEMMLLQAEILELKANPKGQSRGVVIESQFEQGRGPTATVLVQQGTLHVGDAILAGPFYGRVKALINDLGQNVKEAGPSIPVKVLGFDGAPSPGEAYDVLKHEREARELADDRREKLRLGKLEAPPRMTLENLFEAIADEKHKVLKLILKGDVQGSVEAIVTSLKKIESKKIDLDIVAASVGPISESDILLAKASNAVVIGFNTRTDNAAANAAKREGVQIKLFSIIYELLDQVKEAMVGMLDPELRESALGTALVKQVFHLSKYPVAGCSVQNGRIVRNGRARVLRKRQPIYDGAVVTLKRFQDDASEVRAGLECGIRLGDFNDYLVDDIIECYQLEKVPQGL
ncbi:MAG TPA: translation initiation factor IF-2 [Candidatus Methylacidiphilales bacterium]|jgi:translation initiation factor IF-2|nr:translation initiation factor IF-2 [Candidatus Methylacidiphilales bacterium]